MMGSLDLDADYNANFPMSRTSVGQNVSCLAGNVTHDSWQVFPFAPVFKRAEGAYKWDLDGHQLIDFWMGHGSLILGHSNPIIAEALHSQVGLGFHYGGSSDGLVSWAAKVCDMVGTEKIRFCSSGTEATMLALRVARAYTGRQLSLRLDGHFHGWHDEATTQLFDPKTSGAQADISDSVLIATPLSLDSTRAALQEGDVAAVILEPGGGSGGSLPFDIPLLQDLRLLTQSAGTLLIFDEVMSGFRYAPGGAQELAGVQPDITVLAKILSGGLPGAAIAGSAEIMSVFGNGVDRVHGRAKVMHSGTFNGNPLAASAGLAMLCQLEDGAVQHSVSDLGKKLAKGINDAAIQADVDVRAFSNHSIFHLVIGSVAGGHAIAPSAKTLLLKQKYSHAHKQLRQALLLEGIDCHESHGWISTSHDEEITDMAAERFYKAFLRIRDQEEFRIA